MILELDKRFQSEQACREYLFSLRWPDGVRCARCGHGKAWALSRGLQECAACGLESSVTAGTIFQDTRKALRLWLRAI